MRCAVHARQGQSSKPSSFPINSTSLIHNPYETTVTSSLGEVIIWEGM